MFERTDVVFYEVSSGSAQDSMKRSALFVCLCLLPQTLGGSVVVEEGRDVILPCSLSDSVVFKLFEWKKDGQKEVFVYDAGIHTNNGRGGQAEQFKGRVSHFQGEMTHGNASIKITNTKVDDSGDYTCDFPDLQPRQTFHVKLVVGSVVVEEGRDVILPCSLGDSVAYKRFEWKKDGQKEVFVYDAGIHTNNGRGGQAEQFKGRVSHFQGEMTHGNASIKITNTKVDDSGDYTCDFPDLQPRQTFHVKLVVEFIFRDRSEENITDAAPKPYVTTRHQTELWALLLCDAHGAPQLEVKWQDRDGNIISAEEPHVLERGGLLYITVNTNVTKTGHYRCVATQENIGHTISAETFVRLTDAAPKPSVKILDETEDRALLQCDAHGAPQLEVKWQDRDGNIISAEEPHVLERGGLSYITLLTAVTKTGHYRCVATQENMGHTISAETFVRLTDAAPKPYVKILDQTEDRALLQCDAHGAPELEVKWQDRDGNIISAKEPHVLERRGLSYITVNTTVTKTGHYRCVATQENIGHTISAETFVRFNEPDYTGWIVGVVSVIIPLIVLLLIVFYKYHTKQKRIKDTYVEIKKINKEAYVEIKKINKDALEKIKKINKDAPEEIEKINEDTYVEMKKIVEDTYVEMKKILEGSSPETQWT